MSSLLNLHEDTEPLMQTMEKHNLGDMNEILIKVNIGYLTQMLNKHNKMVGFVLTGLMFFTHGESSGKQRSDINSPSSVSLRQNFRKSTSDFQETIQN